MCRELRVVSRDWSHPKDKSGKYIPLFSNTYSYDLTIWHMKKDLWDRGMIEIEENSHRYLTDEELAIPFEVFCGEKPNPSSYMPLFPKSEQTHIQLYEITTEGTPISEIYRKEDLNSLLEWASINIPIFAEHKGSVEQWHSLLLKSNSNIEIDNFLIL